MGIPVTTATKPTRHLPFEPPCYFWQLVGVFPLGKISAPVDSDAPITSLAVERCRSDSRSRSQTLVQKPKSFRTPDAARFLRLTSSFVLTVLARSFRTTVADEELLSRVKETEYLDILGYIVAVSDFGRTVTRTGVPAIDPSWSPNSGRSLGVRPPRHFPWSALRCSTVIWWSSPPKVGGDYPDR